MIRVLNPSLRPIDRGQFRFSNLSFNFISIKIFKIHLEGTKWTFLHFHQPLSPYRNTWETPLSKTIQTALFYLKGNTAQCPSLPKPCVQVYSHSGRDYSAPQVLASSTKYKCEAKLRREFISQNRLMSPCKHKGSPHSVGWNYQLSQLQDPKLFWDVYPPKILSFNHPVRSRSWTFPALLGHRR